MGGERRIEEQQLQCLGKKVTDGAACDTPAVLRGGGKAGEENRQFAVTFCCHLLILYRIFHVS